MERKYKMAYRQRVFLCPELGIRIQYLGKGLILGKCECGKRLRLHDVEKDEFVRVERMVRPFRDEDENEEP